MSNGEFKAAMMKQVLEDGHDLWQALAKADAKVNMDTSTTTGAAYTTYAHMFSPVACLVCGEHTPQMLNLGYGSKYDGDWICPRCLDKSIGLLVAAKKGAGNGQASR